MLFKIQKKLLGMKYTIDFLEYEDSILTLKGWLFSEKHSISRQELLVEGNGVQYPVKLTSGIKRKDVYREFRSENALKSGFYGKYAVEGLPSFELYLRCRVNARDYKIKLGEWQAEKSAGNAAVPKIEKINTEGSGGDIIPLIRQKNEERWSFPTKWYEETIDIIIPVYNGYQYLEKLLETLSLTRMNYRLILIDDKSPDERVLPFLENYAKDREEVYLLKNETNLGFVRSVNRGLEFAEHHVALVNSDVELPEGWLERLMAPILQDEMTASSTPYSNCGVITSFPNIGEDNELFQDLSLKEIDREFQTIRPRYVQMPTGVGFCMGMNRRAIREIGLLDAESFGMGYGEENDWCQRAIEAGFKNVQVENLFVYHKHGGSFQSEAKKRYIEEHLKILSRKHPTYDRQVSKFFTMDPNRDIRNFAAWELIHKGKAPRTIAAFDHDWGGGATAYLEGKKNEWVQNGCAFYIIRFDEIQEFYSILFYYGKDHTEFFVKTQQQIFEVLDGAGADELWLNELVAFPHLYTLMADIRDYARRSSAKLKMLLHDYYAVCPTINLLDEKDRFCRTAGCETCEACFRGCDPVLAKERGSIERWRREWKTFLECCDSITVFSNDSKRILNRVYGELNHIEVKPHQIGYMPELKKQYKLTDSLTIGLLGILTKHKGAEIVKELAGEIEKSGLNIRIVLIGTQAERIDSPVFRETGRYTRDSIPRLTLQNDIDVFLIPSVWPETFSYTTEEVMKMGMPVMCFDLGAPAERVARYEKGYVIPEMSGKAVLDVIRQQNMIPFSSSLERRNRSVLFLTGERSFASRYRVDHLREQLLHQGVDSRCIMADEAARCRLDGFCSVVVYRTADAKAVGKVVKKARRAGKRVYYDMDDFIFEYDKIKDLPFLKGEDYVDFERYSAGLRASMALCDGYIVSTEAMKRAVAESFPGKPIYINRNVASMAMVICSQEALREKADKKEKDRIYLGYFSGTKTHNEDFETVKDQILNIMKRNSQVFLLIGGQIELPAEFGAIRERIERFDFMSWRKLPHMIARADINLMPLEKTEFHLCKSENKWMEAALVRVPTVASWNRELEGVIQDGVTGFLCRDGEEWEETLQKLIDNESLRSRIAEAAYERTGSRYTTMSVEKDVVEALITGNESHPKNSLE